MSTENEQGQISIHAENILPIIKKWLYSERDIFIRELISNSVDAITKLNKLSMVGEVNTQVEEPRIDVTVDKANKTIKIADTGLGMTGEEVKKYINQVAFSGVSDFVKKFEGKDDAEQIIGHFGLGFYSSFMVAERVMIETLSYQEGATPVRWESTGDLDYKMSPGEKKTVGTDITLSIGADAADILDVVKVESLVRQYCGYLGVPIYVQEKQVNNPRPIWTQSPSSLKDEDYLAFFKELFPADREPLFWIHLQLDYPFPLKGVLFFPKLDHELRASEGKVKLFCNQVFVEDNCKELVPDYLTLLKGVIDCPDLPLNVSRSALQNDPKVAKITQHITKKVCDKLSGLSKTEREQYEKYWVDIHPFVKYAMMRDTQAADRLQEHVLFKTTAGNFKTADEYLKEYGSKTKNKIIYVNGENAYAGMVDILKHEGVEAVVCDLSLDQHFMAFFEMHTNSKYSFERIDSDSLEFFKKQEAANEIVDPTDQKTPSQKILDIFTSVFSSPDLEKSEGKVEVKVEPLKSPDLPAVLVTNENQRRMQEMMKSMPELKNLGGMQMGGGQTLIVNRESQAVKNLLKLKAQFNKEDDVKMMVEHIYDMALLQQGNMKAEKLKSFLDRSSQILSRLD